MTDQDLTLTFSVDQAPDEVLRAIKNVRGWWGAGIEGRTQELGDEFVYRHKDIHRSKQKVTEDVPGERIVWRVLEADLSFLRDRAEWTGTEIRFDVRRADGKTEVRFTHVGLAPAHECFDICSNAWSNYVLTSLRSLITTGRGRPDREEDGAATTTPA